MLTGPMFEELRTAYQSCTRVHIDLTKSVSRFGLINIRAWPQRNLNLDFSASCWHKIRDRQFLNDGALHVAYYLDIPSNALDTNCILTDVRDRVLIVLI